MYHINPSRTDNGYRFFRRVTHRTIAMNILDVAPNTIRCYLNTTWLTDTANRAHWSLIIIVYQVHPEVTCYWQCSLWVLYLHQKIFTWSKCCNASWDLWNGEIDRRLDSSADEKPVKSQADCEIFKPNLAPWRYLVPCFTAMVNHVHHTATISTGFTLSIRPYVRLYVRPSVCRPNRFRSVSFTILAGSISYLHLHIISTNFRRCASYFFQNLNFYRMFLLNDIMFCPPPDFDICDDFS